MIQDIETIDLKALGGFDDIIDVRSPAEFAEDHAPGAINLPVLSDEERAEVGTIYVQTSRFEARRIGGAYVAKAKPDGYTFLFSTPAPAALNKLMYKSMQYDPAEDLSSVVLVSKSSLIIVAKQGGFKTVKELLDFAKANPGKLNIGHPGKGTLGHITTVFLQKLGNVKVADVPYRGTAPLMTAIVGVFVLSEVPSSLAMLGILLLSLGTLLMSLRGGQAAVPNRAAVGYALTTSLCIACYTLTDGSGVRLAPTAASYAAWLFVCDGLCAVVIGFFYRGRGLLAASGREWASGIVAGVLSAAAYAIAMWAMTQAHVASVASLRETSILFAMLISVFALGERMTGWRGAAALSIVAGVIALRIG